MWQHGEIEYGHARETSIGLRRPTCQTISFSPLPNGWQIDSMRTIRRRRQRKAHHRCRQSRVPLPAAIAISPGSRVSCTCNRDRRSPRASAHMCACAPGGVHLEKSSKVQSERSQALNGHINCCRELNWVTLEQSRPHAARSTSILL